VGYGQPITAARQQESVCFGKRQIDDMLGNEPHLRFIPPNHVVYEKVGWFVIVRLFGGVARFVNHDFVSLKAA
jgi:hypothetical protein